jgi:hypothetical protein
VFSAQLLLTVGRCFELVFGNFSYFRFIILIFIHLAKLVGKKRCFYKFETDEAYQTENGTILRMTRSHLKYLGDKIDIYRDTDIEGIRVKRAISLLEKSGGQLLKRTKDKGSRRRLEVLLRQVFPFDEEHYQPGMRSLHNGLQAEAGRALLKGFDFNPHSAPGALFGNSYGLDLKKGVLSLHDFSPQLLLSKATYVSQLRVCFLLSQVDFLLGEFITFVSNEVTLTAADAVQDLRLKVGKRPKCDGVHIAYLWIGFERDDAVDLPELLWRVDDVFRVVDVQGAKFKV